MSDVSHTDEIAFVDITDDMIAISLTCESAVDGDALSKFLCRGGMINTNGFWLHVRGPVAFSYRTSKDSSNDPA